jgi:hypothetical protein
VVPALLCGCTFPALAAQTSDGASLQIGHPTAGSAQTVRGVRRETVDHESFAAAPNEILEIVLADGSSVTLASGASVSIDQFHYDRATRLGELQVSVKSGYVRVAGGVLNNTSAVHVLTPQGEARIDNGIASFDTHEASCAVALFLGKSIALTDHGQQGTLDRAHTVVNLTTSGLAPARALTDQEEQDYVALLNPGLTSLVAPRYVADESDATQVSSERILSALNDAKDADTKSNVQNSILPPAPPPTQPLPTEPTAPTLGDITLGLPSANNATLGNLQWSPTSSSIAALSGAGNDFDLSQFFWPINAPPTASSASHTTTTVIGGGQSGELWSTTGGTLHGAGIKPTGSGNACNPTCGYAFVRNYDNTDVPGYFGGTTIDPNGSYLLITYPGGIVPTGDTQLTTQAEGIDYLFRASLGANWTLPGNSGIQYTPTYEILYKSDAFAVHGPASIGTNTFVLQGGFAAVTFNVQSVASDGPGVISIPTGARNAGFYKIWGATPTDPNPCTQAGMNLMSCSSTLINLAHNRYVSEDFVDNQHIYNRFADGSERMHNSSNTLVDRVVDPTPQTTVIRNDDNNFLLFEATGVGTDNRHFLFGNGAVTRYAPAKQNTTLDTFLLSPGIAFFANTSTNADVTAISQAATDSRGAALDNCAAAAGNCELSSRAFFRDSTIPTALPGKLYDTGLLVLNPAGQDVSSVFHADFGLKGSGPDQVSTISGLFGSLTYTDATHSAAVNASLVGSTYGPGTTGATAGITALSSQIVSTSAGGGNTRLSATGGDTRVGYMILETGDAVAGGIPGTEHPINSTGTSSDVPFSSSRLASAAGTQVVADTSRASTATTTNGYLAGLAVSSTSGAVTRISNLDSQLMASSNFTLAVDPVANTVTAAVSDWAPGSSVGGTATNSSYIDNNRFGAADGTRAGIVSGPAVLAGWADGHAGLATTPDANGQTLRDKLNSFKYLQWGFFFGDSSAARDSTAQAHLASWVTGKLTATDAPKPTGTATYEGYMLGNVAQVTSGVTSLYAAVGTFTNTWDFNVRQGDMNMSFDGANYTGKTIFRGDQLNATRTAFVGSNNAQFVGSVSSSTGGRSGVLNGSFIDGGSQTHVGVLGRFDFGSSDGSYVASGTFGAERHR